ncbi:hypothetical protein EAJ04_16625 [Bacteroides faecis]|nr:hypothetical protein EAJ04_16625 [Bacteroides faecis]
MSFYFMIDDYLLRILFFNKMILKYQKKCCICREADAKLLFPNCLLGFVVNNAIERMIRLIDPF